MITINSPPMDGGKTNTIVSKNRPASKRSSKKWGWASHRYREGWATESYRLFYWFIITRCTFLGHIW